MYDISRLRVNDIVILLRFYIRPTGCHEDDWDWLKYSAFLCDSLSVISENFRLG
jgi:hypothetical protein